jgi:hypothetical protein
MFVPHKAMWLHRTSTSPFFGFGAGASSISWIFRGPSNKTARIPWSSQLKVCAGSPFNLATRRAVVNQAERLGIRRRNA